MSRRPPPPSLTEATCVIDALERVVDTQRVETVALRAQLARLHEAEEARLREDAKLGVAVVVCPHGETCAAVKRAHEARVVPRRNPRASMPVAAPLTLPADLADPQDEGACIRRVVHEQRVAALGLTEDASEDEP